MLRAEGISDESVLEAIDRVPRHLFLDNAFVDFAYKNQAFPIGSDQTISHPFTVAFQTQLLELKLNDKVLEIGTGSGYQCSVLMEMGVKVFSIERHRSLHMKSKKMLNNCFKNNKPITIVKPGTQSRRFTHISDTVKICYMAWKSNKCRHYSISNKKSYTILQVAKMFGSKIKYLKKRPGERYISALTNNNLNNKVFKYFGKVNLIDYIKNVVK